MAVEENLQASHLMQTRSDGYTHTQVTSQSGLCHPTSGARAWNNEHWLVAHTVRLLVQMKGIARIIVFLVKRYA